MTMTNEETVGRLISVGYQGYGGSYYQPPEPAELVIWCPICNEETDAQSDELYPDQQVEVSCCGGHDVTIYLYEEDIPCLPE
jgi:hypothetical protein